MTLTNPSENAPPKNLLTVDVEDWFQVEAYAKLIDRSSWDHRELRIESNVHLLLDLFDRHQVKATFFILGWVAERLPHLVREIGAAGHEIGSHGWSHQPIWRLTPEEFRDEARRSRALLCDLSGQGVHGYRAPTFSITKPTLWALEQLAAQGYRYDSSIYPIRHDRYGIREAPLHIHWRPEGIWEIPMSVLQFGPLQFPIAGGGYLRLYPRWLTEHGIRSCNAAGRAAVVYVHPWEFDPGQPRVVGARWKTSLRHRVGLRKNLKKLAALLRSFQFGTAQEAISAASAGPRSPVSAM